MSDSRVSLSRVVALAVAALVSCGCATTTTVHAASYLHLSDIHLDTSGASGDTDLALWTITQEKLHAVLTGTDPPSFVLFTGDLPGHYEAAPGSQCGRLVPSQVPGHDANLEKVLADLRTLVAGTRIPLLFVPGNNDSLAGDYSSFTDENGKGAFSLLSSPVPGRGFPAVNASKPCGEPPCTVSAGDPELGYYSARPVAGLRVIALSSIIWSGKYQPVGHRSQQAEGDRQIDWLAAQLDDARATGDKVLLALHIPPGIDAYKASKAERDGSSATAENASMWTRHPKVGTVGPDGSECGQQAEGSSGEAEGSSGEAEGSSGEAEGSSGGAEGSSGGAWLDRFLDLLAAHTETVVGLAYGHTHQDELRRLHGRDGNVLEIALSAPGITTLHGNNPGFKTVTYDPDTKELLDFTTDYTAYDEDHHATTWGDEYYTFSELYDCAGRATIFECLTSPRYARTSAIDRILRRYYTVMNGPTSFDPGTAIEVEPGQ